MKQLFLLLLCSFQLILNAQNAKFKKPDYKKIGKEIKKKKSDNYYPKLMERFLNADTTMTLEQKRHFYYGYKFSPDYSPYGHSPYYDSLKPLLSRGNYDSGDYRQILAFSDSILKKRPFEIKAMNYKARCHEELEEYTEFKNTLQRGRIIFDAIFSSGDGLSMETAFYVTQISHEYEIVNIFGYEVTSQSLIEHFDFLKFKENEDDIEGFYFDISPMMENLRNMMQKK